MVLSWGMISDTRVLLADSRQVSAFLAYAATANPASALKFSRYGEHCLNRPQCSFAAIRVHDPILSWASPFLGVPNAAQLDNHGALGNLKIAKT